MALVEPGRRLWYTVSDVLHAVSGRRRVLRGHHTGCAAPWVQGGSRMAAKQGLSRRDFLYTGLVGLAGVSLLAACTPQSPAAKPTEAPAAVKPTEAAKP